MFDGEGDDLFRLDGGVGPRTQNHKLDVAKVETLLESAGAFDLSKTGGPTGVFSDRRTRAISEFQKRNGLKVDGVIEPDGETIRSLQRDFGRATALAANNGGMGSSAGRTSERSPDVMTVAQGRSRSERIERLERERDAARREATRPMRVGLRPKLAGDTGPVPLSNLELRRGQRSTRKLVRREAFREIKSALEQRGSTPPTINMEEARQWAILNRRPALFQIEKNPKQKGLASIQRDVQIGVDTVLRHDRFIREEAKSQGVDPDLIRAIMFVENADGNPLGTNKIFEPVRMAASILPMNIKSRLWAGIGGVREEEFGEPGKNIRAGVALVKAIQDRLPPDKRTPEMIGSIWNFTGAERVNKIGARIQEAFDKRMWRGTPSKTAPAR